MLGSRMSCLVPRAFTLLLACVVPGAAVAQDCILDRGSILDGVTTITVVEDEAPCVNDPAFEGWQRMTVESRANSNGLVYLIEVKWNRDELPCRGTFLWVPGGEGGRHLRLVSPFVAPSQDLLADVHQVRTMSVSYLGEGYMASPRNGFTNVSAAYADLLEFLHTRGLLEGVVGHVGSSAGSETAANVVSHHDGAAILQGLVLTGGPFFVDLREICATPGSPIEGGDFQRTRIDLWNYIDAGDTPCADANPNPNPDYDCRSYMGSLGERDFSNLMIHVGIGTDDDDWLELSCGWWLDRIQTLHSILERPDAPHIIYETAAGTQWVEDQIILMVDTLDVTCPTDLNGDGVTDLVDLATLLTHFGEADADPADGDINGDDRVDLTDLSLLLTGFGEACP